MLTSEIRVNGALLGHLYILNLQMQEGKKTLYSVEYYQVGKGVKKTRVLHDPEDGAEKLVEMALGLVMKKRRKADEQDKDESIIEYRNWIDELTEKENECCPEDLRFWEYIEQLKKELKLERAKNET